MNIPTCIRKDNEQTPMPIWNSSFILAKTGTGIFKILKETIVFTLLTNVKVISKEIEDKENNQLDILKLRNTIKTTTKKNP